MARRLVSFVLAAVVGIGCGDLWGAEELKSEAGRFSIMMPGPPKQSQVTSPTALGDLTVTLFNYQGRDAYYAVGYLDYGENKVRESEREAMLDGAVDGSVSRAKGTLIRSDKISRNNVPGREASWSIMLGSTKAITRMRVFVEGDRMYQLLVIGPEAAVHSRAATAFLDSFKLVALGNPGASVKSEPPQTSPGPAWIKFNVKNNVEGTWSVQVPSRPLRRQGQPILGARSRTVFTTTGEGLVYSAQVQSIPAAELANGPAAVFAADRQALAAEWKGTAASESEAKLAGHAGTEYRIAIAGARPRFVRVRSAVLGGRLHTLVVAGSDEAVSGDAADRFFESFTLSE